MMLETLEESVVIDIETSGANFVQSSVLSVAIVPLDTDIAPLQVYIRPEQLIWSDIAKGYFETYRAEWAARAIAPSSACRTIAEYILKSFNDPVTIIAHNVAFDFAFLRILFSREGIDESRCFSHRAIDTHTLLRLAYILGKIPASALSSTGAFDHFSIRLPKSQRHTALADAIATRELFAKLVDLFRAPYLAPPSNGDGK